MTYLCYQQSFDNQDCLKKHFISQHNIDRDNYFFQKLFTRHKHFILRKCFRCEYFHYNGREEKLNNFLSHYQQGGRPPAEDKPFNKIYFDENLQKYCITFDEHSNYHDFFNSQEIVSESLQVFENNFVPRLNLSRVNFKCTFMLINQQLAPAVGFAEFTSSRVWVMNIFEIVYFNDFIKSNLADNIKKKIIMNGITGSSCRFKRFDHICVTVDNDDVLPVDQ